MVEYVTISPLFWVNELVFDWNIYLVDHLLNHQKCHKTVFATITTHTFVLFPDNNANFTPIKWKDSALKVKSKLRLERNLEKPKYAAAISPKNRSLRENQAARLEGQADRKEKENDG